MVLTIEPRERMPFEHKNGAEFYCSVCNQYSANFTIYCIRVKYRRCRDCQRTLNCNRRQNDTDIARLKRKLYYNLVYKKHGDLARAITKAHVAEILQDDGLSEKDAALVKTISPQFDEEGNVTFKIKMHITNKETPAGKIREFSQQKQ